MAMGSASELEYHLLLARDLNLIPAKNYEELHQQTTELKRMLTAFMQKLSAEPLSAESFALKISSILGYV
jgi:four helix bundle protein